MKPRRPAAGFLFVWSSAICATLPVLYRSGNKVHIGTFPAISVAGWGVGGPVWLGCVPLVLAVGRVRAMARHGGIERARLE